MNKYRDKSDFEINKAVAEITIYGDWYLSPTDERPFTFFNYGINSRKTVELPDYCNNPADAMPIVIENNIDLLNGDNVMPELFGHHSAYTLFNFSRPIASDSLKESKTIYRLAMEVFLMMKEAENENNNNS